MHGVAEWMYEHAEEYGLNNDEMYLLGLIHDIGYLHGKQDHEQYGAELVRLDTYYGRFIQAHGLTPQEYMECFGCLESEIPNEMILLWTADMMVDLSGWRLVFRRDWLGLLSATEQTVFRSAFARRQCFGAKVGRRLIQ